MNTPQPTRKSATERLRAVRAAYDALAEGDIQGASHALSQARGRTTPHLLHLRLVTPPWLDNDETVTVSDAPLRFPTARHGG